MIKTENLRDIVGSALLCMRRKRGTGHRYGNMRRHMTANEGKETVDSCRLCQ